MIVPGSANALMLGGDGYVINNSLRFQSASSQYASRTLTATGSTTFTHSFWFKRGTLTTSTAQALIGVDTGTSFWGYRIYFDTSSDVLWTYMDNWTGAAGTYYGGVYTSAVFRDPSAWYHVVVSIDSSAGSQLAATKIYINGVQQTTNYSAGGGTWNPTSNLRFNFSGATQLTGCSITGAITGTRGCYFDGYMAEVNFIDGQALTPSSFGTTDLTSGQWVAAKYAGTYGTNGFYLPFSNGTSTTTLGADSSGNGNNWTLTNFTRSAGVSDCWMYDVPSGNGGASGTQPNSNYCVMSPLAHGLYVSTYSNANLTITTSSTQGGNVFGSIALPSTGKYYWETTYTSGVNPLIGLGPYLASANYENVSGNSIFYYVDGRLFVAGATYATWASYTTGDVIGIAVDMGANSVAFYKNNTLQGTVTGTTLTDYLPSLADSSGASNCTLNINFGQRSFVYTPPSGFKALCTANLPVATIKQGNKYMDATTYTGTGSGSPAINNAGGFKPDLVWAKCRNTAAQNNILVDSVRGANITLESNLTDAEAALSTIASFTSTGFTTSGSVANGYAQNVSGYTYVAWQWQAGQGSTSSNTNGSITSTVSVNATAGFSVVTYTGTGANATVGHGLGVAPKMVIYKCRNLADGWGIYHKDIGNTYALQFDTGAKVGPSSTYFNSADPTASVLNLGAWSRVNNNTTTYVAYCFAEIAGFSKFGSYTGNASADGNFLYFGFRPKFLMIKNITTAGFGGWVMLDSSRNTYNIVNLGLAAESSGAEFTVAYGDFLSNGFKIRIVDNGVNASGQSYIYAAFAENPFQNSNAR